MTYKFVTREEIEQQEKEHDENSIAGEHCCNGQYKMLLRLLAERDAYRAVAREKAEMLCQREPNAEFDVDAEAARILEKK